MGIVGSIELLGDSAVIDSIIDRSITSFVDAYIVEVGDYAFAHCSKLETLDLATASSISAQAFQYCEALTALILRSSSICTLSATSAFANTPIVLGTGYVYVPSSLVSAYKAASNWSTYANQIRSIEDYPYICDKNNWETVAAAIDEGVYAEVYSIGDVVTLDLGDEGVVNMQIAAFDTDDFADGSGKAPISWVSKELLTTSKRMNPSRASTTDDSGATVYTEGTGSIGGWEKTEMRTYVQNDIKALIPEDVIALIKTVTKQSVGYNTAGTKTQYETTDDIWIPSYREVFGGTSYETTGAVYSGLFKDSASRIKKKYNASSANTWWLRSASNGTSFRYVLTDGSSGSNNAYYTYGVALGFCT